MNSAAGCPILTQLAHSPFEAVGEAYPEIRAYKLGKKRWSYNQVELRLSEAGGSRAATVKQAVHASDVSFPEPCQDSGICFHVELESGVKLQAHLYAVYDAPHCAGGTAAVDGIAAADEADAQQPEDGAPSTSGREQYAWRPVMRRDCCKGCQGNVLRSLQRFGRLGKRSWNDSGSADVAEDPTASMKAPKYMYVSVDEACTHANTSAFRLVAGIYDATGTQLLTSTVSPPIRVLANNDVPTGAARIPLAAQLPSDWEGWAAMPLAAASECKPLVAAVPRPKRIRTTPSRTPAAAQSGPSTSASDDSEAALERAGLRPAAPPSELEHAAALGGTAFAAAAATGSGAASPLADGGASFAGSFAYSAAMAGSHSLALPGCPHGSRVLVISQSAWQEAQQQVADATATHLRTMALSSNSGGSPIAPTRSFSLPAAVTTGAALHRPESNWQQQQRMAATAAANAAAPASSNGAPHSMFAAAIAHSASTADLAGQWQAAPQVPLNTRATSLPVAVGGASPFALAAAAHSLATAPDSAADSLQRQASIERAVSLQRAASLHRQASIERAVSLQRAASLHRQASLQHAASLQKAQQAQPECAQFHGGSDASVAAHYPHSPHAALLQQQAAQEAAVAAAFHTTMTVAPGSHSQKGGNVCAGYRGINLRPTASASSGGCVPSQALATSPAAVTTFPAASASTNGSVPTSDWALPATLAGTPTAPALLQQMAPPQRVGSSTDLQQAALHKHLLQGGGMPTMPPAAVGGMHARHALLLQHAEAQLSLARRAAANRAVMGTTTTFSQLPHHLAAPIQQQQQQQQQQRQMATAWQQQQVFAAQVAAMTGSCAQQRQQHGGGAPAQGQAGGGFMEDVPADLEGMLMLASGPSNGFGSVLEMGSIFEDILMPPPSI